MSCPHATTISDHVINLMNRLRKGEIPAFLLGLLSEMEGNCGEGAVTLPGRMKRLCCSNSCVEEAYQLVKNNKPLPDSPRKPLVNSMPLSSIARDIGNQLHASGAYTVDPNMVMPIINKYLVARDNALIGLSIVFTSTLCINSYGTDHNADIAAHIISSILIDESSPKRLNRAKVLDARFCYVGVFNGPHKTYGNLTVIVYAQSVSTHPTSPARAAPPPLKSGNRPPLPTPPPPAAPTVGSPSASQSLASSAVTDSTLAASDMSLDSSLAASSVPPKDTETKETSDESTPAETAQKESTTPEAADGCTPLGTSTAGVASPAGTSSSSASSTTSTSTTEETTHTITKISESADKTAYTMELCPITYEELETAELVKKGSYVVLRHGGREQMWRMPFPLPSAKSISAYCDDGDGSNEKGKTTLMLKIGKDLTDVPGGKVVELVSEGIKVPTNPSVPPKVRPQIKLKTSTADNIEATLGVCSSDVNVNIKLVRTEIARSNVLFEFQFQERTNSGNMKTLKGNQTVRLPFVCSKNDINVSLEENGSLSVRIQAPKPLPFNPNEVEDPISRV